MPNPDRQTTHDLLENLRHQLPDIASAESDIVLALLRLSDLARRGMDRRLRLHDLTPAAFEVLVTLRCMPPRRRVTPTELYRANLLSSGGLTKILNTLADRKLIELSANSDDKRSKHIRLTAKGRRIAKAVAADVAEHDRSLFAGRLTAREVTQLRAGLLKALAAIEAA